MTESDFDDFMDGVPESANSLEITALILALLDGYDVQTEEAVSILDAARDVVLGEMIH